MVNPPPYRDAAGLIYRRAEDDFDKVLRRSPEEALTRIGRFYDPYYVLARDSAKVHRYLAKKVARLALPEPTRGLALGEVAQSYQHLIRDEYPAFNVRHHKKAVRYFERASKHYPNVRWDIERIATLIDIYFGTPVDYARRDRRYIKAVDAIATGLQRWNGPAVPTSLCDFLSDCPSSQECREATTGKILPELRRVLLQERGSLTPHYEAECRKAIDCLKIQAPSATA